VTLDGAGPGGPNVGRYTAIQLDRAGNPVIAYQDETNRDLKLVRCGDPGCASRTVTVVESAGEVGFDVSMVLDAQDRPVIAHHSTNPSRDLRLVRCGDPACTALAVATAPDQGDAAGAGGDVGLYTSVRLDAQDRPVVAYYENTLGRERLKLLRCGDPACGAGNSVQVVDADGNVGQFASLALAAGDLPVVSYYHLLPAGDLKLARCGDPACAAPAAVATLDSADDVGRFTSLRLDAAGDPVVAYWDVTFGDLKVLHCADPACAGPPAPQRADGNQFSGPNVGQYASLRLDGAGNPVVAYYDAEAGDQDLRVVRCGDPACAGGAGANPVTVADAAGDVGQYASLALDAAGTAYVSYYDATNGDLKFTRVLR
jgi:hypothetical protein